MENRKRCDVTSPEARALVDEIVHGTFMKEGTMVAFPMCFPGVTLPIVPDESHITALDVTPEGIVYGGTSGRKVHLFVGMFHGITGVVFDMGAVDESDECAAVRVTPKRFVACVNGPTGGRVLTRPLQGLPFDLIQEWGFSRQPYQDLGQPAPGERILHATMSPGHDVLVGVTEKHLFAMDMETGAISASIELEGCGRLAVGPEGAVWGLDQGTHLWRFDPAKLELKRKAVPLPEGTWRQERLMWAREPQSGVLFVADHAGRLFSFNEGKGFSSRLGQAPLAPVGPMAVTFDGRLFGFCGDELSKMFCLDPSRKEVRNLGVAASVIERRRYGYSFGDAVTGRDGELVFGEDDDRGHLWLYFPRILPRG